MLQISACKQRSQILSLLLYFIPLGVHQIDLFFVNKLVSEKIIVNL